MKKKKQLKSTKIEKRLHFLTNNIKKVSLSPLFLLEKEGIVNLTANIFSNFFII